MGGYPHIYEYFVITCEKKYMTFYLILTNKELYCRFILISQNTCNTLHYIIFEFGNVYKNVRISLLVFYLVMKYNISRNIEKKTIHRLGGVLRRIGRTASVIVI